MSKDDKSGPLRKCTVCGLKALDEKDLVRFKTAKDSLYGRGNLCKWCYNKRYQPVKVTNLEKKEIRIDTAAKLTKLKKDKSILASRLRKKSGILKETTKTLEKNMFLLEQVSSMLLNAQDTCILLTEISEYKDKECNQFRDFIKQYHRPILADLEMSDTVNDEECLLCYNNEDLLIVLLCKDCHNRLS